ncbi:hypothetical protein H2198_001080 [Neophaeococcomyces mojaviensis]|uniref:Uncharacterized protein n=1 Tax=Neophaeococcomyces mojaviensis TaxID=3383035 RepID=A0ACC3AIA8_9EURO|nr:hypothetical protein H2198_001080 [Knufia sp. JES_112]
MVQWPPSPSVEDEEASLAREHLFDSLALVLKTDEQNIPSRGSVDQHPVIEDSDTQEDIPVTEATDHFPVPIEAPKPVNAAQASSLVANWSGFTTPPPSDNESRGLSYPSDGQSPKEEEQREPRSKSTNCVDEVNHPRSRPSVSRIQTDIAGEHQSMKTGTRRTPSPYAYSRETGTFKVNSSRFTNGLLSPVHTTSSPLSMQARTEQQEKLLNQQDRDSSTDSERRPRKTTRFAGTHQGPGSSYGEPRDSTPGPDRWPELQNIQSQQKPETFQPQPRVGRTHDRETSSHEGKVVPRKAHRSSSRRSRPVSTVRESSYSSSAEESVKSKYERNTEKANYDEWPVRRRSSHRHEKNRLDEPLGQVDPHAKSDSSSDETTRRVYYIREGRSLVTPPMVTTPKYLEDYFNQALEKNALKGSRHTPRSLVDESVIFSPPSSPPHTLRTEQQPQGYSQSPLTSPRCSSRQSRPPWEENQFVEYKASTSLLSQATAAATIAAKNSPPVSTSSSNTIDTNSSGSIRGTVSTSRSSPQSPVQESSRSSSRADTSCSEHLAARPQYLAASPSNRPSTWDVLPKFGVHPANTYQPQRNASWTSYDHQIRPQAIHISNPHFSMTTMNTAIPSRLHTMPPGYRSQVAPTRNETMLEPTRFVLPQCPRSQPTKGLRDWTSIKGIPNIDICPKCMGVLASTRFHKDFVKSLDKRYDQTTVCAMSKPWIRIAVVQSLKQNRPDLTLLRTVETLPEGVWQCKGARADVRTWWKLLDPVFDRPVPDFYACSACVKKVNMVFPDLPNQFERADLSQEKSCNLHTGSKHFKILIDRLDEVAEKCRDRGKRSARYMQPFVDHVRKITRYPECARDSFLINRPWHYMNDLPEFTICEACYEEVVLDQRERPIARDISKVTKLVPYSALRSTGIPISAPTNGTHAISCQLYSNRMRRLFTDAMLGRIGYETFKAKAKERYAAQWRLTEMNKMYEEDQKMGWDRRTDIEKNRLYWSSME